MFHKSLTLKKYKKVDNVIVFMIHIEGIRKKIRKSKKYERINYKIRTDFEKPRQVCTEYNLNYTYIIRKLVVYKCIYMYIFVHIQRIID